MAKLVITIDEATLRLLKHRAQVNRRGVEDEAADILRHSLLPDREAIVQHLQTLHAQLQGRRFASSAELIREDRDR
jgi:plasmid stability protein